VPVRRTLLVCLALLFFGLSALAPRLSAASPPFRYDTSLAWWVHQSLELASEYTGSETKRIPLPTYVRCYTTDTAFNASYGGSKGDPAGDVIAYYESGTSYVNVRALTCAEAHQFTDHLRITETTAGAVSTLLHEALHRQGLEVEKVTECYGDASTKYAGWLAWWQGAPHGVLWKSGEHWGDWAEKLALQDSWDTVPWSYLMSRAACRALVKRTSWADRLGLT
jgi:hypothetical protein